MTQLTFVPGALVPAAGWFAAWSSNGHHVRVDGLPDGVPDTLPTVQLTDGAINAADVPARRIELLAAVRVLAALPPGDDWPHWRRPSDTVLAWSVAAKLACELVAAGKLVPTVTPADELGAVYASWRLAADGDDRMQRLAAMLPPAAFAVRGPDGSLPTAVDALHAFGDAVADALVRGGQRPQLDPRRRESHRAYPEQLVQALRGVDPTVARLRMPADEVVTQMHAWGGPLLERERALVRLALRLVPPDGDAPWRLALQLAAVADPAVRIDAGDVWAQAGSPIDVAGQPLAEPGLMFVRRLASAARLFTPLDRALSAVEPVEVALDANEVADLLDDGVDALATAGVIVDVPPELRRDAIERVGLRLRIGRTVDADVDDVASLNLQSIVSGAYELVVGDEPLTADEFTTLTAGTHPLVKWRGRWVRVDSDVTAAAAATAGQVTSLTLTEALMSALTGRLDVDGIGTVATRATGDVAELIGRLRSRPRPEDARVVGFVGELRDYQRRGVAWLQALAELGIGGVLADEMGLGKTVQAIALLASRQGDRPHLVVCPTSVVGNWERELARFAPDLPVIRHHGVDRQISRSVMRPGRVIVTSFALLRRDQHLFGDIAWDVVVFDEAQQIKNAVSKTARAARTLDSRVRIAMTGTPLENRLAELWAIIDVTNPGLLGSRRTFDARFAAPIERWHDDAAAERLRRLIAPFVLRRRKDDAEVSVSLPPKQELTETCGLTREQAQLYRTVIDETFTGGLSSATFERRGQVLALLTALKQICNHPEHYLQEGGPLPGRSGKLLRFTELIEEIVADDASVLVFTQFRRMGDLLAKHLSETLGLTDVPFLHGGVPLRAREAMVDRFQLDPTSPPVLLVSLRAGGTGLNLTRATHVVHVDRWWNPAVEDQATDRAHRIGQEQRVTVHTMVTAGTIESRIADLLERKRSLADAVVGTGEAWISDLDDDELHELVALSTDEFVDEDDDQRVSAAEPQRPRLVVVDGGRS